VAVFVNNLCLLHTYADTTDIHYAVAFRTKCKNHYNHRRTHNSLGYRTPAEFVASRALARADEDFTKEPESVIALSSG
jgi:transposase InsO family protein